MFVPIPNQLDAQHAQNPGTFRNWSQSQANFVSGQGFLAEHTALRPHQVALSPGPGVYQPPPPNPQFNPAYRPQQCTPYVHDHWRKNATTSQQNTNTTGMPEWSPERQVRQAVAAVDHTISKAETERDIALTIAQDETRKRLAAEAELKRLQEELKNSAGENRQLQAMLSPESARKLDEMFNELDQDFRELDFSVPQGDKDHKLLKTGHAYIDKISRLYEPMGETSNLSDAEFVMARYKYAMCGQLI